MSTLADASQKAQQYATNRSAKGAAQKCPLIQTGIIVLVMRRDNEEMIKGATIDLKGPTPGNQSSDGDGMAKFDERDAGTYTITTKLPSSMNKDFATPDVVKAGLAWEMYYIAYLLVEPLPRPKIKLLREDNDRPVPEVGVTLTSDPDKYDLGKTKPNGLAEWDTSKPGLKEGSYTVAFTFKPEDAENVEITDMRAIQLKPGAENIFPFHVRYCWVEFVVNDPFDKPVSDVDYVLTYPDGKKTKKDKLKDGKVNEKGPPGTYKFALKLVVDAAWKDTPLEVDQKTTLRIWATGYDSGTEVTVEIFDACGLGKDPLDTVKAKLTEAYPLEVEWTPAAAKLDKLTGSSVIFTAKVGTSAATSGPAVVNRRLPFKVLDEDGKPVNTKFAVHLADGTSVTPALKENQYEALVPWNQRPLGIELPDHKTRRAGFKDDAGERDILIPA